MADLNPRITVEPGKMGGQPCIRGLRFTVYDVASYLASGMTEEEILKDFPYLEKDDFERSTSSSPACPRGSPFFEAALRREPGATPRSACGRFVSRFPARLFDRIGEHSRCDRLGIREGKRVYVRDEGQGLRQFEYSPGRSAEGGPGANRQFLHGTNRKCNPSNAVRLSEFEHDSKRGLLILK